MICQQMSLLREPSQTRMQALGSLLQIVLNYKPQQLISITQPSVFGNHKNTSSLNSPAFIESYNVIKIGVSLYLIYICMMDEPEKAIRQKLRNKNFSQINILDPTTITHFIAMIQHLEPQVQNFKLVKILLLNYGFPAMIYLDRFYQNLPSHIQENYEEDIKVLASIALQMADGHRIPELQFLFKFGLAQKYKSKKKSTQEKQFIQSVDHLSQLKKKFVNKLISEAQLKNYVQIEKKKYSIIPFFQHSFQRYLQKNVEKQVSQQSMIQLQSSSISFIEKPSEIDISPELVTPQNLNDLSTEIDNQSKLSIDTSSEKSFVKQPQVKKEIPENSTTSICCKTFFYQHEDIKEYESEELVFRNFKYPFKGSQIVEIKEIMCCLLNSDGGNLFIGIRKMENGRKVVEGNEYSESDKENILRNFRQFSQAIEPDIITQKMYRVDFVPIRNRNNRKFITGGYVIKVNVRYGIRDDIYSYRENGRDFFPFRSQNQIIHKEGRILLKILKQRIKNPLKVPIPRHPGVCKQPQLGELLHQSEFQTFQGPNLQRVPPGFKEKAAWPPKKQERRNSPPLMKKTEHTKIGISTAITNAESNANSTLSGDTYLGFTKLLPEDIYCQQSHMAEKQFKLSQQQFYFFVVGINEKQLSPVLEKKGILHHVKMESTRQSKLVLKAFSDQIVSKLRKILKKIEEKYASNNIKIYEITLCLQVSHKTKALQVLSTLKEKYSFDKNRIKFTYFRDSLKAFLLLQSLMEVRFISP